MLKPYAWPARQLLLRPVYDEDELLWAALQKHRHDLTAHLPESLVYVRVLDPALRAALPFGLDELMLPVSKFWQLDLPGHTVLMPRTR